MKTAADLIDYTSVFVEIQCTKCSKSKKEHVEDELQAIEYFFKVGWRATSKALLLSEVPA